MINAILLMLFAFTATLLQVTNDTYKLTELRQFYLEASKDEDVSKEFYKLMRSYNKQHPVVLAYKGASEATMGKYLWNPYSKLKHIQSALDQIGKAVELDKTNPEIRFIRFTIEHYIPRYLSLSEHIKEDKAIVINALKQYPNSGLPKELAYTMHKFLLSKDHLTAEEKAQLEKIKIN
jgi:uncharacterized protein YaaR (DUF327 family)